MKRPHRLEVALVIGKQRCRLTETTKQVTGEEHPGVTIEGTEGAGKMGIRGKHELQQPVLQLQLPLMLLDQPEPHADTEVLDQPFGTPVADDTGIIARHPPVDLLQ